MFKQECRQLATTLLKPSKKLSEPTKINVRRNQSKTPADQNKTLFTKKTKSLKNLQTKKNHQKVKRRGDGELRQHHKVKLSVLNGYPMDKNDFFLINSAWCDGGFDI